MPTFTLLASGVSPWLGHPSPGYGQILTTTSVSPSNGSLVLFVFQTQSQSSGVTANAVVTGLGLTWTMITNGGAEAFGVLNPHPQQSVYTVGAYYAQGNPTPGALTVTMTGTDAQRAFQWAVVEVTDVRVGNGGADAIRQTQRFQGPVGSGTTFTFTTPALPSSALFATAWWNRDTLGDKHPVNLTELFSNNQGSQPPPVERLGGYMAGGWGTGSISEWDSLVAADEPVVMVEIFGRELPWLRQRQRDDAVRAWAHGPNNPRSEQYGLRISRNRNRYQ